MSVLVKRAGLVMFALLVPAAAWSAQDPHQPRDLSAAAHAQSAEYQRIARDIVLDAMLESASTFALTFYRYTDPGGIAVEQDLRFRLSEQHIELEYRLAF